MHTKKPDAGHHGPPYLVRGHGRVVVLAHHAKGLYHEACVLHLIPDQNHTHEDAVQEGLGRQAGSFGWYRIAVYLAVIIFTL